MTMNPLPPQAYTKDTLTKAYMWLGNQNASIKELATTPDILVSLFLKAQRNGGESLETPSIQNFKNELKSLAGMMGDLESRPTPGSTIIPPPQTAGPAIPVSLTPLSQSAPTPAVSTQLDSKSQEMIAEVKKHLNLSSDIEVMRLLISLGYHRAKTLYS